jgi:DNA-binding transcriptional LysR family regulator
MDLEDLQTFVDVADAGGVSSAARRLGVSKSIVSRRLFRLEAVNSASSFSRGRPAVPR